MTTPSVPRPEYTGHSAVHAGLQGHSVGPIYPAVLYAMEFAGDAHRYHGLLREGFDYGVWREYDDAVRAAALLADVRECINRVRGNPGPSTAAALRAAQRALDSQLANRAARAGLNPEASRYQDAFRPSASEWPRRDESPVSTAEAIRGRYGYGADADRWLTFWGFNPTDYPDNGEPVRPPYNSAPAALPAGAK